MGSLEIMKSDEEWDEQEEQQCLQKLKNNVKGNKNLDNFSWILTDRFLLHFVRGKKYDEKKAYSTLKNYFYLREKSYPNFFKTLRPSNTLSFEKGTSRVLKGRDFHNRRVSITRFGEWDPEEIPAEDLIKGGILLIEETWNCEDSEKDGVVIVIDLNNYGLNHVKAFGPSQIKALVTLLWSNYPLKYKGIHLTNMVYVASLLLKAVTPFFPKKLKERLHVHGSDMRSLHEHIPPEVLPKCLGGDLDEEEAFDQELEKRVANKEEFYRCFSQCLK